MRLTVVSGLVALLLTGCATASGPSPVSRVASAPACGWSLWRQEQVDRQLVHSKVADFPDQPACLATLKSQVHPALPAYPMTYLTVHAERPGWLACFPTVGYEPEKYK